MTRMNVFVLALALLAVGPMAAQAQTNVTGDWVVTIDTPQGPQSIDLVMKQAGEELAGTVVSPMGSVEFKGKIVKESIDVTYNLELQGNAITIAMTGTVAGDSISGNLNFGGLGDVPWTAARKKAGAAAASTAAAAPAPAATPSSAASPASSSLTGKWDVTFNMAGNPMPATATFTQMGEKVTGTLASQAGETPVSGTMTGGALKLEFTVATPQGDLQITMTGDLGPNGIAGKASLAGLGDADWSATRAK
jgi:hypothetical protein